LIAFAKSKIHPNHRCLRVPSSRGLARARAARRLSKRSASPHVRANFIYCYAIIRIHLLSIILILYIESPTILVMPPKKPKPSKHSKPSRNPESTKKWSMYPSLHNDVSILLREHSLFFQFYEKDDGKNYENEYDTNIMGRFVCRNSTCSARAWSSKQIAITIRSYPGERYNARVYHQYCKSCGMPSKPYLDVSYAERVAYRIKKWCGVQMEVPPFSGRSDGPHRSDLCEGCKQGHCSGMGLGL